MNTKVGKTMEQEYEEHASAIKGASDTWLRVSGEQAVVILRHVQAIKDGKLYRARFKTFEEFCRAVVNATARRVKQKLVDLRIRELLGPESGNFFHFLTDGAVAELKDIEPAAAIQIVQQAQASHPKRRVTAAGIKRVRQARVIDAATGQPEQEHRCPCCGQPVKRDAVLVPWPAVSP